MKTIREKDKLDMETAFFSLAHSLPDVIEGE